MPFFFFQNSPVTALILCLALAGFVLWYHQTQSQNVIYGPSSEPCAACLPGAEHHCRARDPKHLVCSPGPRGLVHVCLHHQGPADQPPLLPCVQHSRRGKAPLEVLPLPVCIWIMSAYPVMVWTFVFVGFSMLTLQKYSNFPYWFIWIPPTSHASTEEMWHLSVDGPISSRCHASVRADCLLVDCRLW